jgi:hypothetical protein
MAPSREGEGGRGAFERRTDGGAAERNNLNGGFVAVRRPVRPAVPRRIS